MMPAANTKHDMTPARARVQQLVRRRWLRELLFEDWSLKLLALAITLGLWLGVTSQRAPAQRGVRSVALSFLLPEDMEISNDPREQVEVTLSGESDRLNEIVASNLVVSADVRGYQEGERVARLTPENVSVNLPDGVRVVKIEPGSVPLRLERRIERQVEVVARVEGRPAEGFEVQGIEITPARITVRGPASHVQQVERAPTETISLNGLRESFIVRGVAVDIEDEKVAALEAVVTVQVKINEPTIERRFTNLPSVLARGGDAPEQSAQRVAITLRGARSVIERLKAEELRVVWQADTAAGDGQFIPRVVLPPGLTNRVNVVSVEPARLTLSN